MQIKEGGNRSVVWFDWDEWKFVYKCLYSNDISQQKIALKRILAWKSRSKLPISIEVTSYFIELQLNENNRSENELELGLSMAITRMVNGFIDSTRDAFHKSNMFSRADQLNLPSMFVDIRHDASHGRLPSFRLLGPVSKTALSWIHDYYWIPQLQSLDTSFDKIRVYLDQIINSFNDSNDTIQYQKWVKDDVKPIGESIFNMIKSSMVSTILVPLLLDNSYLLLAAKGQTFQSLPNSLTKQWQPLLKMIHSHYPHFLTIILMLLNDRICKFKTNNKKNKLKKKQETMIHNIYNESQISLMTHWTLYFLKNYQLIEKTTSNNVDDDNSNLKDTVDIEPPYKQIMESCLENMSSKYCSMILGFFLSTKIKFPGLSQSSNNSNNSNDSSSSKEQQEQETQDKVDDINQNDLDSIKLMLNNNNNNNNNNNTQQQRNSNNNNISNWKIVESWKACPVGLPIDNEKTDFSLPLELDDNIDSGNFVEASQKEYTTSEPFNSVLTKLQSLYPSLDNSKIINTNFKPNVQIIDIDKEEESSLNIITNIETTTLTKEEEDKDNNNPITKKVSNRPLKKQKILSPKLSTTAETTTTTNTTITITSKEEEKKEQVEKEKEIKKKQKEKKNLKVNNALNDFLFWK